MSRKPDSVVVASCLPLEQAEEIRTQLERVLNSQQFRSSRRCQTLLRHVTEQTLAGDTLALKERTLGISVFHRTPDYDTSQDPVVRATAAEIRKKLAQYYQETVHDAELRIEMLPGSYVPEFHLNEHTAPPAVRRHRRPALIAGISGVVVLAGVAVALLWPGWRRSDVERFWSSTLQAPGPVLICMGQPIVYNLLSAQAQDKIQGIGAPQPSNESPGNEAIPKKDLVILPDRYVALGDAVCLVRLTALFEKYGKPYRIRGQHSTSFADLRENPAVMIAAFDNQWTLHATGQLRFTFVKDSAHDTDMVRDSQHPENKDWKLTGAWPYWDVANDYAIVSRVRDVNSDRPVVIAAGITQYGTMATGEFLTTPEYLSEAISKLPNDWQKKNLQIVLRVPVVRGTPGRPRVLATHVW
jgi:hypothetical protein